MEKTALTKKQNKIIAKIKKLEVQFDEEARKEVERTQKAFSSRKEIPVFFAADDNYLPYLSVTLRSMKENADRRYRYRTFILHDGIKNAAYKKDILAFAEEDFGVEFVNVSKKLQEVKSALQLRDYYTGATYYRIFIAGMFPQYDKALYLDGDIVVRGDISKLFAVNLGNNLVGAVPDMAVASVKEFREYTAEVLNIDSRRYFNAGVLLMNLKKFREDRFYDRFCALLREYKFSVAQDQDYLNILCKDKVKYLSTTWNTMPIGGAKDKKPMLIHYNLTAKPWHYDDIPYADYFWDYAKRDAFYFVLKAQLENYSKEQKENDAKTEKALIALAASECKREDNYYKVRCRAEKLYAAYRAEQNVKEMEEFAEETLHPVGV